MSQHFGPDFHAAGVTKKKGYSPHYQSELISILGAKVQ